MKPVKFQNKYRIPSARAQWHDYNGGEYFVTICTRHRQHYFGEIRKDEMILSEIGKYAVECIENVGYHFTGVEFPLFVVMPNHVHLIVLINDIFDGKSNDCNGGADGCIDDDCTDGGCDVDCRDVIYGVSTGTAETGAAEQNSLILKNEKMQSIANKCGRLSHAISNFKSSVTRYANENKLDFGWQARFHDHIVRDQEEMNRIADYIQNNVLRWKEDKFYTACKDDTNENVEITTSSCGDFP